MPRKPKPVPGHSTLIRIPESGGQLDPTSLSKLLKLLKIDLEDARSVFETELSEWGRTAYKFYEQERVTLPTNVVRSALTGLDLPIKTLAGKLFRLDTQSEFNLVIACSQLQSQGGLEDSQSTNAVERIQQIKDALVDLAAINKLASTQPQPKRGRKSHWARYQAIKELLPLLQEFGGLAPGRRINRENGRPEGPLIEAIHLCLSPLESDIGAYCVDTTLRQILTHGGKNPRMGIIKPM